MDSGYPPQNYQPPPTGYGPVPQNFKNEDLPRYESQDGYGYTPIPAPQKQTNNSAIIVSSQPTPTIATTTICCVGDHYLTLSIVLTIFFLFCGTWPALFCTVPAIILSTMARDAEARGDIDSARANSRWSLECNIGGLTTCVIAIVIVIIMIIVKVTSSTSSPSPPIGTCSHYYDYYYSSYVYNCGK